ncbi:MAG: 7-cyano-7-deazaguanine synthase [archaeon]|nr:7-cyano-7-deazaguanine synthase [archaeon]
MNLNEKIDYVKELIKDKKIAIAFSGGADSTLLCYLAKQVASEAIAITVDNKLFSKDFIDNCKDIANEIGIKHIILEEDFYNQPDILKNDSNRCFLCRNLMYTKIIEKAHEEDYSIIADGNNISDLVLDRPGILVNYENNIFSPFIEAKLESYEIEEYLNQNNISYSKSTTCLATRFKDEITKEKIAEIDSLETLMYDNFNSEIVKVRVFDDEYIVESENFSELNSETSLNSIQELFNDTLSRKVNFTLREIKGNDKIILDEKLDFFMYELPYPINIENTKKQFESRIDKSSANAIILKDEIAITKKGLITAREKLTKEEFMDILPLIRRNI